MEGLIRRRSPGLLPNRRQLAQNLIFTPPKTLSERSHPAASLKSRSGKPGLVEGASPSHLFEPRFIGH